MTAARVLVVASTLPEVTVCALLAANLSVDCVLLPEVGLAASLFGVRGSPPSAVNTALFVRVPLALAATLTVYETVVLEPAAIFGVPVHVIVEPDAVHARPGEPAVCDENVRPLGNVSATVTVPLVAEPPLFSINRL